MKSAEKKHLRTDIQALRALAVMSVLIYHLWPNRLTGGFMGVDIFFVISGYLMTLTLLRNIDPVVSAKNKLRATGKFFAEFYARRIKRLIPAASVTLLGVLGMIAYIGNMSIIETTAKQVTTSALFVQNLFLAHESIDYLASANPPTAVQHFWSLSLEEQFYLAWPLALLLIVSLMFHVNIVYKRTKISGAILPISLLVVIFFIYGYQMTQNDSAAAYFVTFARVWELLIGALIAFLPKLRNHDLKLLLPWAGLALVSYALYKLDGSNFPGWHATIPVVGTALIIWGGAGRDDSKMSFTNTFKAKIIQWIGNISYSLYLWHWPFIILLPIIFAVNTSGEHGKFVKLGILVLSFVVAWLSYRFVEQPTQRLKLKKRWIYLLFVLVVGGVGASGFIMSRYAKAEAETRLGELHKIALSKGDPCLGGYALSNKGKCNNPFGKSNGRFSEPNSDDTSVRIARAEAECVMYWPKRPSRPETRHLLKNTCVVGDASSSHKVIVWGDSHAQQWTSAFDRIGIQKSVQFIFVVSGNCQTIGLEDAGCTDRIKFIRESGVLKDANAIIVSMWHRYDANHPKQPVPGVLEWIKQETGVPLYLLEDIPSAKGNGGPRCTIERKSCINTAATVVTPIKNVSKSIVDSNLLPEGHIISIDDLFCKDNKCYSYIGGIPVYRDVTHASGNSHLTGTFSVTVADELQAKLESHGILFGKD